MQPKPRWPWEEEGALMGGPSGMGVGFLCSQPMGANEYRLPSQVHDFAFFSLSMESFT